MNREQIIRFAREAGLCSWEVVPESEVKKWEHFAGNLHIMIAAERDPWVIEQEREACAALCDKMVDQEIRTGKVDHNEMPWTMYCANIIRARGQE